MKDIPELSAGCCFDPQGDGFACTKIFRRIGRNVQCQCDRLWRDEVVGLGSPHTMASNRNEVQAKIKPSSSQENRFSNGSIIAYYLIRW